ncbi:MAG TPA: MlaE family lipid ABC transporter permease subunit [Thermohalobaculum sp.]|nr:MlaE family lipid ABC transporter permease subunit [Thermohalobaculum sp.]
MDGTTIEIERTEGGTVVRPAGRLVLAALAVAERRLAEVQGAGPVVIDLERTEALDTGGAWLLLSLEKRLGAEGTGVEIRGASPDQQALIETVRRSLPAERGSEAPPGGLVAWLADVGRRVSAGALLFVELLSFFGLVLARLAGTIVRPWRLRLTSLVYHCQEVGLNAVPIVALMAFLIGLVLAFQGAMQLRQFGAEIFVVDLLAISVLRELGILLTAIIVAGRSGSAFTASIGSMKMREEIDAMGTLGLDWAEVLVLPRVLALVIMLPILGFIADVAGLTGGALMAWLDLGISPALFIARLWEFTDVWHFAIGMIKAPFFALIIGVIGCFMGMKVGGSAESVGQHTTASVVAAIFSVIVCDAIFSIFFAEIGV